MNNNNFEQNLRETCTLLPHDAIIEPGEDEHSYGIFYLVSNLSSGDFYVGFSEVPLFQTWMSIAYRAEDEDPTALLYKHLKLFGLGSFHCEALCVCPISEAAIRKQNYELGRYNADLDVFASHHMSDSEYPNPEELQKRIAVATNKSQGLRNIARYFNMTPVEMLACLQERGFDVSRINNRLAPAEFPTEDELRKMASFMSICQIAMLFGMYPNKVKVRYRQYGIDYPVLDGRKDKRAVSFEEASTRVRELYGDTVKIIVYNGMKKEGIFECDKGHTWHLKYFRDVFVERKHGGCPICRKDSIAVDEYELAMQLLEENHNGRIKMLSFTRMKGEATFQCLEDPSHVWTNKYANAVVKGLHGCPFCSAKKVGAERKWTKEKVQSLLDELYDSQIEVVEYQTTKTPAKFRCRKHQEVFEYNQASTVLNGELPFPCPICRSESDYLIKPYEEFLELLKTHRVDEHIRCVDYKGMWTETEFECSLCGAHWRTTPKNVVYLHTGCPKCSELIGSLPECTVFYYMSRACPAEVVKNPKLFFIDDDFSCEADVYVPSLKLIVEYDGVPWHDLDDTRQRDIKREKIFSLYGLRVFHLREIGEKSDIGDFYQQEPLLIKHPTQIRERSADIDNALIRLFELLGFQSVVEPHTWDEMSAIKEFALNDLSHPRQEYSLSRTRAEFPPS